MKARNLFDVTFFMFQAIEINTIRAVDKIQDRQN